MRDLTITEAEKLHGGRLDRRRVYATTDDGTPCDLTGSLVFEVASGSSYCTGCENDDGPPSSNSRGAGCSECGYTGRRKYAQWVPVTKQPNPRSTPKRNLMRTETP